MFYILIFCHLIYWFLKKFLFTMIVDLSFCNSMKFWVTFEIVSVHIIHNCSSFLEEYCFYWCASLFLLMLLALTFDINDIILAFNGYNFGGIFFFYFTLSLWLLGVYLIKSRKHIAFKLFEDFFPTGEFNQILFIWLLTYLDLFPPSYFVFDVYHFFFVSFLSSPALLYFSLYSPCSSVLT